MSSDLTRVLHVAKKNYFNFALNFFFMKELKGAILSQIHMRSKGGSPRVWAPSIEMQLMTKI